MNVTISISMGDPTGIGPEVILKALQALLGAPDCPDLRFVVFGAASVFEPLAHQLSFPLPQRRVEWVEVGQGGAGDLDPGALQVRSLELAAAAVAEGEADALCTAPITKAAAMQAGFAFPGHTEYLGQRFQVGADKTAMMLAGPTLRVVPITGHLPLRQVAARITSEEVARVLVLTVRGLADLFGCSAPRIALAGLNPHAGEAGMLGHEERDHLVPGIQSASRALQRADLPARITGPVAADSLFGDPAAYDAVVCCYHDQALIPLKTLHRDDAVNITLGLPIVRTSPAHGSAREIAGRGVARPNSMIAALRLAAEATRRRRAAGD